MGKKTIWYNFGECAKPNSMVLKRHNIDGSFELIKTSDKGFTEIGELLRGKWCYLDDLLATSKALDVAIQHIQVFKSDHLNGRMEGCCLYSDETPFDDALNEINEIMKEDK